MHRSRLNQIWYDFLRLVCRVTTVLMFRIRCAGRDHVPADGGVLIVSNHQSHLDPVLIGVACNRRLDCVARATLFDYAPLGWLIDSLGAFPIDREGMGLSGVKETLRRVKRGGAVLLFPEGTRTSDGELAPLKPGFYAIARRAAVPIVPLAVDGAYEAWPRSRRFPRPGVVRVEFGPPITPQEIEEMDEAQLTSEIERRIAECLRRARLARTHGAPAQAP